MALSQDHYRYHRWPFWRCDEKRSFLCHICRLVIHSSVEIPPLDYQSRRLNIRNVRVENEDESDSAAPPASFCHTVNGTACAVPRTIMAICEQQQTAEGHVAIPDALVPFMGGARLIEPVPKSKRAATQLIKSPLYFVGRTLPDEPPTGCEVAAEDSVSASDLDAVKVEHVVDQVNRMKTP